LERVDRKPGRRFTPAALDWLSGRRYSGNIRELRNLIERASLLADGERIDVLHLQEMADDIPLATVHRESGFGVAEVVPLDNLEMRYIAWAKEQHGRDLPELAKRLGVSQRTLYRKLQGLAGN